MTTEASGRLKAKPPLATGLSRKSPTVAPSGLMQPHRENAEMNSAGQIAYPSHPGAVPTAPHSSPARTRSDELGDTVGHGRRRRTRNAGGPFPPPTRRAVRPFSASLSKHLNRILGTWLRRGRHGNPVHTLRHLGECYYPFRRTPLHRLAPHYAPLPGPMIDRDAYGKPIDRWSRKMLGCLSYDRVWLTLATDLGGWLP